MEGEGTHWRSERRVVINFDLSEIWKLRPSRRPRRRDANVEGIVQREVNSVVARALRKIIFIKN